MTTITLDSLLADLNRFPQVTNEIDAAAHSKVGEALFAAAKDILPLVPDGPAVDAIITKLHELAQVAHGALTAHEKRVADAKAAVAAQGPAPAVPEMQTATIVDTAPAEPKPAPTADAPAEDPSLLDRLKADGEKLLHIGEQSPETPVATEAAPPTA